MEDPKKITTSYVPEAALTPKQGGEEGGLVINDSSKFEIDENRLLYSLLLENDNTGGDVESKAIEEGFRRQKERHVTILGGATKRLLKNALAGFQEEERKKILKEIKNILESLSWKFVPKEIYKIQKQDYFSDSNILESRQSYINMIDMPDIEVFYKKLNSLLKTDLPIQLPHITLFTKGEIEKPRYYGIPV